MAIVNGTALESNKNFRVSFDGGNLSSDGGLLLLMEFYYKLGVNSLIRQFFHTTDSATFRVHKDHENLNPHPKQVNPTLKFYQNGRPFPKKEPLLSSVDMRGFLFSPGGFALCQKRGTSPRR